MNKFIKSTVKSSPIKVALFSLFLSVNFSASAATFSFGLWGDMPYEKNNDNAKLPRVIDSINQSNIAFSIYDGDIKDGSSECTDDKLLEMKTRFNNMNKPLIYVLGDNEWTDCHRTNNGSYDALERLSFLRKNYFTDENSLGKEKIRLFRQGAPTQAYSENVRFNYGDILLVGMNVPGSNNNLVLDDKDCTKKSGRTPEQCVKTNAEYKERDAKNILWLKEAFNQAKQTKAKGIVVVIQGDPGFDLPETEEFDESTLPQYQGYQNMVNVLADETKNFNGQVLFVHGDTHFFKVDKPLFKPNDMLDNFTRLETFGSPQLHWVKVDVDTNSDNIFNIQPVIVK